MLQILNRDWTSYASLSEYDFSTWTSDDVNTVEIEGNPDQYISKIAYLYDNDMLIGSGLIENGGYNKNTNKATLSIYPLIYDLRQDFLKDSTGMYVYYSAPVESVIESIITKYRASVTSPVLYMKTKQATGKSIRHTLANMTWLEAFNYIKKWYIAGDNYVTVDPDGGVNVYNSSQTRIFNFGSDIFTISYEKYTDEIINYIVFDNWVPWNGHLSKIYQDTASIAAYGKRVHYIKDSRFKYIESADAYIATFFSKNAQPKIVVDSIKTEDLSINLYDKIIINNWEKTFDGLQVVKKIYHNGGVLEIKVGTDFWRTEYEPADEFDVSSETLITANAYTDNAVANVDVTLPSYIKETYIDSTEVRSPILMGNLGYISDILKIGQNGLVLNGVEKSIRSASYIAGSVGWKIGETSAEFNDAIFRGTLEAASGTLGTITSGIITGTTMIGNTIKTSSTGSRVEILQGGILQLLNQSGVPRLRIQQEQLVLYDPNGNEAGYFYGYSPNLSGFNGSLSIGGDVSALNATFSSKAKVAWYLQIPVWTNRWQ